MKCNTASNGIVKFQGLRVSGEKMISGVDMLCDIVGGGIGQPTRLTLLDLGSSHTCPRTTRRRKHQPAAGYMCAIWRRLPPAGRTCPELALGCQVVCDVSLIGERFMFEVEDTGKGLCMEKDADRNREGRVWVKLG